MLKKVGVLVAFIFVVLSFIPHNVIADNHDVSQSNRFLAAEAQRAISAEGERIEERLVEYQETNFQIFDTRMSNFIEETMYKTALVSGGVTLVVMGFAALVIVRSQRKNPIIDQQRAQYMQNDAQVNEAYDEGSLDGMQQQEWRPQQPRETVSTMYGQEQASTVSDMNSWQNTPAYAGSWKAPNEIQKEYNKPWQEKEYNPQDYQKYADPEQMQEEFNEYDESVQEYDGYDESNSGFDSYNHPPQKQFYDSDTQSDDFDDVYGQLLDEIDEDTNAKR